MGELVFYIPRTDYLNRDDYDLLDAILISGEFRDEGVEEFGDYTFRRYVGQDSAFGQPRFESDFPERSNIDGRLAIYMRHNINEDIAMRLSVYGIFFVNITSVAGEMMYQYSIDRRHLPLLATICHGKIKPSKRVVEEQAFRKFAERGYGHGCDLSDWFTAEWEAEERILSLLNRLR